MKAFTLENLLSIPAIIPNINCSHSLRFLKLMQKENYTFYPKTSENSKFTNIFAHKCQATNHNLLMNM